MRDYTKTNKSALPKIDNPQSMFSDDSHPILDTKVYSTQDKPKAKPKAKKKPNEETVRLPIENKTGNIVCKRVPHLEAI